MKQLSPTVLPKLKVTKLLALLGIAAPYTRACWAPAPLGAPQTSSQLGYAGSTGKILCAFVFTLLLGSSYLTCMQIHWSPALCPGWGPLGVAMSSKGKYRRIGILSAVMVKGFSAFLGKKKIYCCLFLYLWKRGLSSEESKQHLFLWILHGCSLVADGITLSEMAISWVSLWTASRGSSCKVQFAELWAHLWEELHYMVLACWKH